MLLTGSLFQSSIKLFGLIILFVLIIIACYYVTRFIGSKGMGSIRESNIKVIDTYRVNQNQCLLIVVIGKQYYLLASNKDCITLLTELQEDNLSFVGTTGTKNVKFQDVFSALTKKQKNSEDSVESNDSLDV